MTDGETLEARIRRALTPTQEVSEMQLRMLVGDLVAQLEEAERERDELREECRELETTCAALTDFAVTETEAAYREGRTTAIGDAGEWLKEMRERADREMELEEVVTKAVSQIPELRERLEQANADIRVEIPQSKVDAAEGDKL